METGRLDVFEQDPHYPKRGSYLVAGVNLVADCTNGYEPAGPAVARFLTEQGRGKFIRPLYRALMEQGAWGQALARHTYAQARPTYHPLVQAGVDRIMTPA